MSKNVKRTILGILAAGLAALGTCWGYEVKTSIVEIPVVAAPAPVTQAASPAVSVK